MLLDRYMRINKKTITTYRRMLNKGMFESKTTNPGGESRYFFKYTGKDIYLNIHCYLYNSVKFKTAKSKQNKSLTQKQANALFTLDSPLLSETL
ncbi:MAG: hypothetical protein GXP61_01350 [Epsilonproteobacteria bacterium]|nr:hypothetical protein [Campylobacterota bacterium]